MKLQSLNVFNLKNLHHSESRITQRLNPMIDNPVNDLLYKMLKQ